MVAWDRGKQDTTGSHSDHSSYMDTFAQNFLDIVHLRKAYGRVITLSEFFTLYDIPPNAVDYSGRWNTDAYTPNGLISKAFPRDHFEFTKDFIRLDRPLRNSDIPPAPAIPNLTRDALMKARGTSWIWSIDKARRTLVDLGYAIPEDNKHFVSALEKLGQRATYTFHAK